MSNIMSYGTYRESVKLAEPVAIMVEGRIEILSEGTILFLG